MAPSLALVFLTDGCTSIGKMLLNANSTDVSKPLHRIMMDTPKMLGWNVPPEHLPFIPTHWFKYPEPEASIHYLLAIVYVMFFIMATIGNGLVLWVFSAAKTLRTPSNMFVVNLAFCDFIMMLKSPIFIYNSFSRGFAAGPVGCQIFGFVGCLSGIGGSMTNACIAYDRYTTISNPLEGKLTKIKALVMIVCVWGYTLPWAILPLLEVWGRFVPGLVNLTLVTLVAYLPTVVFQSFNGPVVGYPTGVGCGAEGYLTACTFDYFTDTFDNHLFVAVLFTFSYAIPMTMIIYFYSQIVGHVMKHEKALREQAKKMNVESLRSNVNQASQSAEIRIAKAAITICFLFVASWTPYAVMALIGSFGDASLLTPGVTMIPALTCKLVACLDPYVYAISHPRYRVELQNRLPWLAIKEENDTKSVATLQTTAPSAEEATAS